MPLDLTYNTGEIGPVGKTNSIVALSSSVAVMVYAQPTSLALKVGSISGGDIIWGAEQSISPYTPLAIKAIKITSTTVLINFADDNNSKYNTAVVATIDAVNKTAVFGIPLVVHTRSTGGWNQVLKLPGDGVFFYSSTQGVIVGANVVGDNIILDDLPGGYAGFVQDAYYDATTGEAVFIVGIGNNKQYAYRFQWSYLSYAPYTPRVTGVRVIQLIVPSGASYRDKSQTYHDTSVNITAYVNTSSRLRVCIWDYNNIYIDDFLDSVNNFGGDSSYESPKLSIEKIGDSYVVYYNTVSKLLFVEFTYDGALNITNFGQITTGAFTPVTVSTDMADENTVIGGFFEPQLNYFIGKVSTSDYEYESSGTISIAASAEYDFSVYNTYDYDSVGSIQIDGDGVYEFIPYTIYDYVSLADVVIGSSTSYEFVPYTIYDYTSTASITLSATATYRLSEGFIGLELYGKSGVVIDVGGQSNISVSVGGKSHVEISLTTDSRIEEYIDENSKIIVEVDDRSIIT
jgi:hypothetical protein